MVVSKVIRNPLCATLVGALVAAMVVSFVVFVQSGEAVPRAAAHEQPSSASVVSPMIVGGTAVPDGKYPFIVHVRAFLDKGYVECTGTLIDSNSVLTAAHCLANRSGELNTTSAVVVVGRTDLRKRKQGKVIGASKPFIHPRYKGNVYDAAVLKLGRPVKGIKPIKLATAKQNTLEKPGHILTAAGWGIVKLRPGNKDIFSQRMHEVSIPVVSDSRAKSTDNTYVPSLEVAAGKKGKGACFGDSGGPLFDPGSRTQVGITSHGLKCAAARYPANFTEINNPINRNFIVWAAKQ